MDGGGALAGVARGVGLRLEVLAGVHDTVAQDEDTELVAPAVGGEVARVPGEQPVGAALGVVGGGELQLGGVGDVEGVVAAGADDGPGPGVAAEPVERVGRLPRGGPGQHGGLHLGDTVPDEAFDGEVLLGRGPPGVGSGGQGHHVVVLQQLLEAGEGLPVVRRDLVEQDDVGYEVQPLLGDPEP